MAISGGLLIRWLPFAFTVAINVLEVGIALHSSLYFYHIDLRLFGDAFHLHGHDARTDRFLKNRPAGVVVSFQI